MTDWLEHALATLADSERFETAVRPLTGSLSDRLRTCWCARPLDTDPEPVVSTSGHLRLPR